MKSCTMSTNLFEFLRQSFGNRSGHFSSGNLGLRSTACTVASLFLRDWSGNCKGLFMSERHARLSRSNSRAAAACSSKQRRRRRRQQLVGREGDRSCSFLCGSLLGGEADGALGGGVLGCHGVLLDFGFNIFAVCVWQPSAQSQLSR
jgi:hypothetical protein